MGSEATSPKRSFTSWAFAALVPLLFLGLFARNMTRALDTDEDQFVTPPVVLVRQGLQPYVDYPYFHMPLLVYLYAGLTGWTSYKLLAARFISTACATAIVVLLFAAGWRALRAFPQGQRWLFAGGVTLTFCCSRIFTYTSGLAWNHDTAVLCLVGAWWLHGAGMRRGRLVALAAAGFLVGCAIGIRLSFAFAFVPFVISVLAGQTVLTTRQRLAGLALACGSGAAVLAPALLLFIRAPEQFWFGNVGFAEISTQWYARNEPRAMSLAAKLGVSLQTFFTDPGNAFFLLGVLFVLAWAVRRREVWKSEQGRAVGFCLGLLAALAIGVVGPTPLFYQYNYMLLPFMALVILFAIAAQQGNAVAVRRWAWVVGIACVVTAGSGLPRWYKGVLALPFPRQWETVVQHERGRRLREQAGPDALVLTLQPSIAVEAGLEVYPEYVVGGHAFRVGPLATPDQRRKYHLLNAEDLARVLEERPPDLILCTAVLEPAAFADFAASHGYRLVPSNDDYMRIWVRPVGQARSESQESPLKRRRRKVW